MFLSVSSSVNSSGRVVRIIQTRRIRTKSAAAQFNLPGYDLCQTRKYRKYSHFNNRSFSSSSSSSSSLSWSIDERSKIGTITLQSFERYNPLTVEMGNEFQSLVQQLQLDLSSSSSSSSHSNNIRAIVLTGQTYHPHKKDQPPTPAFSAGGNVQWLHSLKDNPVHVNVDLMMKFYNSFLCIRNLPIPILAALSGPAIGAGACLALACDLRIAATNDNDQICLGFPFVKLGIPSGMGATWLLKNSGISTSKINEILLTGASLTGSQAYQLGLINQLVENDTITNTAAEHKNPALEATYELAKQISMSTHPVAVRSMIQSIRRNNDRGLQSALYRDALSQAMCYNRNDWGEGVSAVMEKRTPNFDDYNQW